MQRYVIDRFEMQYTYHHQACIGRQIDDLIGDLKAGRPLHTVLVKVLSGRIVAGDLQALCLGERFDLPV